MGYYSCITQVLFVGIYDLFLLFYDALCNEYPY